MNIFGLGTPEIILILILILMFFGKDKLPELARNIGKSFNALKEGFRGTDKNDTENKNVNIKKENSTKK